MNYMETLGEKAKIASRAAAAAGSEKKNEALKAISDALLANVDRIMDANSKDMESAQANGMSAAMQDRLRLDEKRITAIAAAVLKVVALPDPIGEETGGWLRPNGLRTDGRHWYYLRVPPERDRRRCRTLPESRQCRDPARRQGSHPLQHLSRAGDAGSTCECGSAP